jgi:hypothetical protein
MRRFITQDARPSQQKRMRSSFTLAANYTVIVWLMYPIFWILSDGLRQLDDNAAVIAFSVLDMASKIGFSAIFFHACKKSDDWLKSMFKFSRKKSAQTSTSAQQRQQPAVPAPALVATDHPAASATDSVLDIQSPTDFRRKPKANRCGRACLACDAPRLTCSFARLKWFCRERSSTTGSSRGASVLSPVKTGALAAVSASDAV